MYVRWIKKNWVKLFSKCTLCETWVGWNIIWVKRSIGWNRNWVKHFGWNMIGWNMIGRTVTTPSWFRVLSDGLGSKLSWLGCFLVASMAPRWNMAWTFWRAFTRSYALGSSPSWISKQYSGNIISWITIIIKVILFVILIKGFILS